MRNRKTLFFGAGILDGEIPWLLRDEFNGTVAAGSINGTYATDGVNLRTSTDANSKWSIGSGQLDIAIGGLLNDDIYYPVVTRVAGKALLAELAPTASGQFEIGWDNVAGGLVNDSYQFWANFIRVRSAAGDLCYVGTYSNGTSYKIADIMRTTSGYLYLIKGGAYTEWTLMFPSTTTAGNKYPSIWAGANDTVATMSFVRIPQTNIVFAPLLSDSFNRADAAMGTADGAGSVETGGTGAWTDQQGTFAISSNVAVCSAVDGTSGIGASTLEAGTADVVVEVVATRTAGTSGLILRYTDASNYIKFIHDGTNAQVIEVVAGTPNTLKSTAVAYGAAKRLIISLHGTSINAHYGDAAVTVAAVTTAVTSGTKHGLFTDDTGATFNNACIWRKTGVYNVLDKYSVF